MSEPGVQDIDLATTENPDEDGMVACFECEATFAKHLAFEIGECPECGVGLHRLFEQRDEAEEQLTDQLIDEAEGDTQEVEA